MNWLKRKIINWLNSTDESDAVAITTKLTRSNPSLYGKTSYGFTIFPAVSGHVIQCNQSDRYRETDGPELYLVPSDKSISETVEHIMMLNNVTR